MSYYITLAEIEAYLRTAARASGLEWGLAEEAGKAARWLAAFDLPGPETMLAHLRNLAGKDYAAFIPRCDLEPWQAADGPLCPVITGAALADRSATMLDGIELRLGKTAYPILLAATLGQAARFHRSAFTTRWADLRLDCFGNGLTIEGDRDSLLLDEVDRVSCCKSDATAPQQVASTEAYNIDEDVFKRIDALAFETYAPATEESRAGAGAGLTDND